MSDQGAAEDNHCEREEVGDAKAKGHSLIDSQELEAESQDGSCDEAPSPGRSHRTLRVGADSISTNQSSRVPSLRIAASDAC